MKRLGSKLIDLCEGKEKTKTKTKNKNKKKKKKKKGEKNWTFLQLTCLLWQSLKQPL